MWELSLLLRAFLQSGVHWWCPHVWVEPTHLPATAPTSLKTILAGCLLSGSAGLDELFHVLPKKCR